MSLLLHSPKANNHLLKEVYLSANDWSVLAHSALLRPQALISDLSVLTCVIPMAVADRSRSGKGEALWPAVGPSGNPVGWGPSQEQQPFW